MSEQSDSLSSLEWLNIARKDWNRVRRMLKDEDSEAEGFFLQQSMGKYLKAFLLQHGWKLRKIHELDALLDEAVKYRPDLKDFYDLCEHVSGYYFVVRYPPLGAASLPSKEVEDNLQRAEKFIKAMFAEEQT